MQEWVSTFPGYSSVLATCKKAFGSVIQCGPVPRHVGIIMDGSRRYSRAHKIEIREGHNMGFETMASVLELLYESGVEHATVFAFSIENFNRSSFEVQALMDLARDKFKQISQHGDLCDQYGIKIRILGNRSLLPPDIRKTLLETEDRTKHNKRAVLNICFSYTSRDEIASAIKDVVHDSVSSKNLYVDEETLESALFTKESPPLDVLIRTSGHMRFSDFLLWQAVPSSCTVYFIDKLWPEFTPWEMAKVLVKWSFNVYWYGNGSGFPSVTQNKPVTLMSSDESEIFNSSTTPVSNTGYKRFASNGDSDDHDSDTFSVSDDES